MSGSVRSRFKVEDQFEFELSASTALGGSDLHGRLRTSKKFETQAGGAKVEAQDYRRYLAVKRNFDVFQWIRISMAILAHNVQS